MNSTYKTSFKKVLCLTQKEEAELNIFVVKTLPLVIKLEKLIQIFLVL